MQSKIIIACWGCHCKISALRLFSFFLSITLEVTAVKRLQAINFTFFLHILLTYWLHLIWSIFKSILVLVWFSKTITFHLTKDNLNEWFSLNVYYLSQSMWILNSLTPRTFWKYLILIFFLFKKFTFDCLEVYSMQIFEIWIFLLI